jgi:hypothetical protein
MLTQKSLMELRRLSASSKLQLSSVSEKVTSHLNRHIG